MTIHACLPRTGKTVVRRLAALLAAALILSGCTEQRLFAVKAVAAGVPSLAPFFEEDGSLGRDETKVRSERPHSGLQQGNTPGLYGGTRKPKVCDVDRLKDFLTDPRNKQKAREWARIVGITPDRIEEHIDGLTPVLLRHDTLVKNHDYKKGKAVAFDALLESGIAVLVNDQGLPAVKCSCGNPLQSFDKDPEKISVKFEDGNRKWGGFEKSAVVTVRPAPQPLDRIALVDVDNPDRGINRPVGSTGESDTLFKTTERNEVPAVAGMTFNEASQRLAALGLAVSYSGDDVPPGDAPVTASDPAPGTPLRFGKAVTLSVDPGEDPSTPRDPSTSSPGPTTSSPTEDPTESPTRTPTENPTGTPTETPTDTPTRTPAKTPTETPTNPTGGGPGGGGGGGTGPPGPTTPPPSTDDEPDTPTSVAPPPVEPTSAEPPPVESTRSESASGAPETSVPASSTESATGEPAAGQA